MLSRHQCLFEKIRTNLAHILAMCKITKKCFFLAESSNGLRAQAVNGLMRLKHTQVTGHCFTNTGTTLNLYLNTNLKPKHCLSVVLSPKVSIRYW